MRAREVLCGIRVKADAATPGPWHQGFHQSSGSHGVIATSGTLFPGGGKATKADSALVASARTDVPRLVAALNAVLDLCGEAKKVLGDPDVDQVVACIEKELGR